ncbi:PepSY-associated TM helix domain-containing protein [Massilia aerilata]|uniref:PepSY-associated TM helix domain-containing protein n=1 Tax=Massilia aerilata TaxID=453817 RepID=A0ABW0S1U8_9BURK
MGPVTIAARRRSLFWRIHFWAALIASPFAFIAVSTGMLYIFTPQIEAALYGQLERVAPQEARLPLDAAVEAARKAAPAGFEVLAVTPPARAGDAVRVGFGPPRPGAGAHAGHGEAAAATAAPAARPGQGGERITVFVDPYRGQVLGSQRDQDRFSEWARRLHSRLLQGESLRWMIELAASWMLVMLLTGLYLWWPRPGQPALPRSGARGRAGWKQWHAFIGVLLGVLSLAMVLTGITWSKYAGENVRALRDWSGQASPQAPARLHSMPQGQQLSYQQAWDRTRALVPDAPPQLTPPRGPHGVWRAGSADRRHPASRFDLVLNAYDGQVLYRAGWDDQTAFGKATAVGIPFHRGELGVWNQLLLFVFAAGVLFSLVSGWVMFFQRRRAGALGLPKLLPGAWRAAPPVGVVIGIGMCALMPLLAWSAAAVIAIEAALHWRQRRA